MKLKITVHGVAYEVDVEILDPGEGFLPASPLPAMAPRNGPLGPPAGGASPQPVAPRPSSSAAADGSGSISSPIAGTVVEVNCKVGDAVDSGAVLITIEAMKMNTPITADRAGKVKRVAVSKDESVREGQLLVELE